MKISKYILALATVFAVPANASEFSSLAYIGQMNDARSASMSMTDIANSMASLSASIPTLPATSRSNLALVWQNGVNNEALITQSGYRNVGLIRQIGHNNNASITQTGVGHRALVAQAGRGNVAIIRQR